MSIMRTLTINGTKYNVTPVVPADSITLVASAWVSNGDKYSQVVDVPGVTANTKVDLQPTSEQLEEFHYKVLAFVAENDGGTVTVYAVGDKPENDHTIQITKTEVEGVGKIRGNTVGTTTPRSDWNQTDPKKADFIFNKPSIPATSEDVGARPNTWLPTIAEIGAAPAGYGLDNDFKTYDNTAALDSCFTCGWVRFFNTATDDLLMGSRRAIIRIDSFTNSIGAEYLSQTAYLFYDTIRNTIQRICYGGTWGEWEWVNPPMTLGVEYRTTERWNGKPVYVQAIDAGTLPNNNFKQCVLGVNYANIVDFYMLMRRADIQYVYKITYDAATFWYERSSFVYYPKSDMSLWTGTIVCKYTK